MKLRNKETGKLGYLRSINWNEQSLIIMDKDGVQLAKYQSLAELNEEWEDYEEPKKEFYITAWGDIREYTTEVERFAFKQKLEIGNYFKTREEANKAVEKLKAWKRLKDKGFRFINNKIIGEYGNVTYRLTYPTTAIEDKDLDLLFGGEE